MDRMDRMDGSLGRYAIEASGWLVLGFVGRLAPSSLLLQLCVCAYKCYIGPSSPKAANTRTCDREVAMSYRRTIAG